MSKKAESRVISARLHPKEPHEKIALEIFNQMINGGYSPREILTDAILRLGNVEPEMFRERGARIDDNISETLQDIKDELIAIREEQADQMRDLLLKFKAADPTAFRAFAEDDNDEDVDLDEDFIANAKKAMRPGFRRIK